MSRAPAPVTITAGRFAGQTGMRVMWRLCTFDKEVIEEPSACYWPIILDSDPTEVHWLSDEAFVFTHPPDRTRHDHNDQAHLPHPPP